MSGRTFTHQATSELEQSVIKNQDGEVGRVAPRDAGVRRDGARAKVPECARPRAQHVEAWRGAWLIRERSGVLMLLRPGTGALRGRSSPVATTWLQNFRTTFSAEAPGRGDCGSGPGEKLFSISSFFSPSDGALICRCAMSEAPSPCPTPCAKLSASGLIVHLPPWGGPSAQTQPTMPNCPSKI